MNPDYRMKLELLAAYNNGWQQVHYFSREEKEELLRRMNRAKLKINKEEIHVEGINLPIGLDLEIGKEDVGVIRFNVRPAEGIETVMTETETAPDEAVPVPMMPEQHYREAMRLLSEFGGRVDGDLYTTNTLIRALTHSVLAAVRESLDYEANHPAPTPTPPIEPPVRFEEDDDRP